jgi:hypothetical protein
LKLSELAWLYPKVSWTLLEVDMLEITAKFFLSLFLVFAVTILPYLVGSTVTSSLAFAWLLGIVFYMVSIPVMLLTISIIAKIFSD